MRRQKTAAADAEANCEAAQGPNMRFVPVKCEEKQGAAAAWFFCLRTNGLTQAGGISLTS